MIREQYLKENIWLSLVLLMKMMGSGTNKRIWRLLGLWISEKLRVSSCVYQYEIKDGNKRDTLVKDIAHISFICILTLSLYDNHIQSIEGLVHVEILRI